MAGYLLGRHVSLLFFRFCNSLIYNKNVNFVPRVDGKIFAIDIQ